MVRGQNVRVCGRCGCKDTKVINCRQSSGVMRRMRECVQCGHRYTTVEIDEWWYQNMVDSVDTARDVLGGGRNAVR